MVVIGQSESLLGQCAAVVGERQRGRKYFPLLHHAHRLRRSGTFARRHRDVGGTLRRIRIVGRRDRKAARLLRHGKPVGLRRRTPRKAFALGRDGHLLRGRALRTEGQRGRLDGQRINDRIGIALLFHGHVLGLYVVVIRRPDGDGGGTRLGRRVRGDRNQQFSGRSVLHRNPVGRGGQYIFPLHTHSSHGNLLRSRILRAEGQLRGGYLQRRLLYALILGRTCHGNQCRRQNTSYLFHLDFALKGYELKG